MFNVQCLCISYTKSAFARLLIAFPPTPCPLQFDEKKYICEPDLVLFFRVKEEGNITSFSAHKYRLNYPQLYSDSIALGFKFLWQLYSSSLFLLTCF